MLVLNVRLLACLVAVAMIIASRGSIRMSLAQP
jgi:hypothetical protein